MSLPLTITGISLDIATVGPYRSSAGNYYFFGRDADADTTLQCYKATDPSVSWSSIANDPGFSDTICDIACQVVGDVVHLIIFEYNSVSGNANVDYRTFNMATEAFVISETIASPMNIGFVVDGRNLCSIVIRSDGSAVATFLGTPSSGFNRVNYSRRLGTNNWTAAAELDDGGSLSYHYPVAVLGNSDAVQFVYYSLSYTYQKTLASDNSLKTATTAATHRFSEGISYELSGATKCIFACRDDPGYLLYFDAADAPTLHIVSLGTIHPLTLRLFERNGVAYILYNKTVGTNYDYYFRSSADGGATWSAETFICHSSNDGTLKTTSRFAKLYPDVDDILLPFIYTDASSLKHDHKVVATSAVNITLPSAICSVAIASMAKTVNWTAPSALTSAVAVSSGQRIIFPIAAQSSAPQFASFVADGGDVTVNLESVAFNVTAGFFGMAKEGAGVARVSLTRLGPGGYPIATLAGAGAPSTEISLFSVDSAAATNSFVGYQFDYNLPAATSAAATTLPVWLVETVFRSVSSVGQSVALGRSIAAALPSISTASAFADAGVQSYTYVDGIPAVGAINLFDIDILTAELSGASAQAAVGDFSPYAFTGTSVALNSVAAQAAAENSIVLNENALRSVAAYAGQNILHMEGDEAFSLAAAAAAGTAGDLLVAIVIPPAIQWLVCASIEIMPEVAGDPALNAELQSTVIAAAALQGNPQINPAVDGSLEILLPISGAPAMKEC